MSAVEVFTLDPRRDQRFSTVEIEGAQARQRAAELAADMRMAPAAYGAAIQRRVVDVGTVDADLRPAAGVTSALIDWEAVRRDMHDAAGLPGGWG